MPRFTGHTALYALRHAALLLAVAAIVAVAVCFSVRPAQAHGPAKWIADGNYKNAVGELCCGERDCGVMVGGTVHIRRDGYEVNATFMVQAAGATTFQHVQELVPFAEATPSPTGEYWRCFWGGKRKCFFAPPQGM